MQLSEAIALVKKLEIENQALSIENNDLKKEQKEFQDVLIFKIQEIEKLGWWQRIGKYWTLLVDLINTIKMTIDEQKKKRK